MHLKIFYPGGVTYGTVSDNATNDELYKTLYLAATIEEGNGNGKAKKRINQRVDVNSSGETQHRRRNSTKLL